MYSISTLLPLLLNFADVYNKNKTIKIHSFNLLYFISLNIFIESEKKQNKTNLN